MSIEAQAAPDTAPAAPSRGHPAPRPEPSRRPGRLLLRLAGGSALAVLLLAAAAGIVWWRFTRAALPAVDGERRVPGLSSPAVVRRDGLGVPHIEAASLPDAFRAQGYVTAQDRLWQMDLLRRRALGELAEAFGEGALRADIEVRTLGLGHAARQALPALAPDSRLALEAYAAGVNALLAEKASALPVEFRLLRYRPRAWTVVDTMAVGKLLAHDLAEGWQGEALRANLARRLPADVMELLYPPSFPGDRILFGTDGGRLRAPSGEETSRGSNNWVITGTHTASGKPLLANDPHLGLGVPSIWSAVHLVAPGLDVAGMALPGTPGVLLGRNRRVAWGCTNVHDDSADLYVEEFEPGNPDRYRTPSGWQDVTFRDEPISVRRGLVTSSWRTEPLRVRETRHGPLVEVGARLYALRWAEHDPVDDFLAFLRINQAEDWEAFRNGLAAFAGPSQNFVYADVEGRIAWYSAGRLPVRRSGNGLLPYAGATDAGEWLGYVPFDELPHVVDPPSGRIATANNRLVGSDYPYTVTRGGVAPYRAGAIWEGLEAREGWTADDMVALQSETLSIPHRDLARLLRETALRHSGDAVWRDVEAELRGWDGRLRADSRPAALAFFTYRAVGDRAIGPHVQGLPQALQLQRRTAAIHRLLLERPGRWLPRGMADWDSLLRACWQDATAELGSQLGADRAKWSWGAVNRLTVRHPLGRALPALGWLLDPPSRPAGGGPTTPNVLATTRSGVVEGPSMRLVADLADPDQTRLVNFMGQSGHPASPHYDDQFAPWIRVESRRLPMTPEAVARETRHTLRLVP